MIKLVSSNPAFIFKNCFSFESVLLSLQYWANEFSKHEPLGRASPIRHVIIFDNSLFSKIFSNDWFGCIKKDIANNLYVTLTSDATFEIRQFQAFFDDSMNNQNCD